MEADITSLIIATILASAKKLILIFKLFVLADGLGWMNYDHFWEYAVIVIAVLVIALVTWWRWT